MLTEVLEVFFGGLAPAHNPCWCGCAYHPHYHTRTA
jgi:hypothetical protein